MIKRAFFLALLVIVCFAPSDARQQSSDQEIIRQARQSSYSLKRQGLIELKCTVQPDWDSMYAAVKADKVGTEQLLPIMKNTHFTVLLGPDGASTVSHESDVAPPNEEIAGRVRRSVDGMEQVLTGFFQTWSSFMFNSLLPEPSDKYQLEKKGEEYDLSFGERATQVAVVLNLDLVIEEVKLTSPQLEGTLHPQWSPSNNGLVLSGYQGSYKTAAGQLSQLSAKISYEQVEGLSLPSTVDFIVPMAAGTIPIRLVFEDYQVKLSPTK